MRAVRWASRWSADLIFSQMVTLYLTPVFYTYMDTFQSWLETHFGKMTGKRNADLADGHVSAD